MGIKTRIEEMVIHTVTYNKLWVTIVSSDKLQDPIKIKSVDADNLYDAGLNHIQLCQQVKIALATMKAARDGLYETLEHQTSELDVWTDSDDTEIRADIPPVSTTETEQTEE